ncbi:MAG: hypothetical protein IJZ75_07355 [Clostridia bacterium]|nr:hypothetical protein [Clostridia bacterium]
MIFPLNGNENLRASVFNMINSRRIPHAIIIEGDEGTGRHTLAYFLAKAAVCRGNERPCDRCRDCGMASSHNHPDIIPVSPEENKKSIPIARAREIRAEAYVKPHSADKKVYIIDHAERMEIPPQNALLKVLEEPPEAVIFIIITTSRTQLLPTIVSRCVCLSLTVPDFETAFNSVKNQLKEEVDDEAVKEAVKSVGNNIGLCLSLLESRGENKVRAAAKEFLRLLFDGSEYEMLRFFVPFEKDRVKTNEFFECLKIEISAALKKDYKRIVRARALTKLYSFIDEWQRLLKTNINLPLLFSAVVCKSKSIIGGNL